MARVMRKLRNAICTPYMGTYRKAISTATGSSSMIYNAPCRAISFLKAVENFFRGAWEIALVDTWISSSLTKIDSSLLPIIES